MSAGAIIGIIIAIIVVAAVTAVVAQELRRARLRRQFGPEYSRLAEQLGSNRKAEAELIARQRRAAKLNIRPLSADQQARYAKDWTTVQEQFIDSPSAAVLGARRLVARVMRERGYPVDDQHEVIAALSVHHARQLDHYRKGQDITGRSESASTEELREAVLSYREVFNDVVGGDRNRTSQPPAARQVKRPQLTIARTQLNRVTGRAPTGASREK